MFKKKSHVTRILDFMYEKSNTFYTIDGFQKFLPDIHSVIIQRHVEDLEKDGLVEARTVWKAATQTPDPNTNPQKQNKGYRLTTQGLVLVKTRKQKSFNTKATVIGITIVALVIPTMMGVEYFEFLLGAEPLPSNQVISVPVAADTLNTKIESSSKEPDTPLPAANPGELPD